MGDPLELELQVVVSHLTQEPGTELQSLASLACALHHLTICPASPLFLLEKGFHCVVLAVLGFIMYSRLALNSDPFFSASQVLGYWHAPPHLACLSKMSWNALLSQPGPGMHYLSQLGLKLLVLPVPQFPICWNYGI